MPARVSRSKKTVTVEVLGGTVHAILDGHSRDLPQGSRTVLGSPSDAERTELQPMAPPNDSTVFLDPRQSQQIHFKWQGVQAEAQVQLWAGPDKSSLHEISPWLAASGN